MRPLVILLLADALLLSSCDQQPAYAFKPGDHVRLKTTHEEGVVALRTTLFKEDRYWVTFPGNQYVLLTPENRRYEEALDAQFGTQPKKSSHEEGPFIASDLEIAHQ